MSVSQHWKVYSQRPFTLIVSFIPNMEQQLQQQQQNIKHLKKSLPIRLGKQKKIKEMFITDK